ncbi:MAG: TauD/TfdA family dioxygenase [Actinomycetota bacterium]|nr:MAG: TauD/TfdA family dioxygenase [Actinomycetota bacterium]
MTITRIGGALGARVDGLDLAHDVSEQTMDQLRAAFAEHQLLVFPGQAHISAAQQAAFARRWADPYLTPDEVSPPCVDGVVEVMELRTAANTKALTDQWHSDNSYAADPPWATFLISRQIPAAGGDTMWANQYAAFDSLSDELKRVLRELKAVHCFDNGRNTLVAAGLSLTDPGGVHPVVRVIPQTGREALFLNERFASHFVGMTWAESRPLMDYLTQRSVHPNFTYRHRWSLGDLVMWDNRCLQHFAINDYTEERVMHRLTIAESRAS